MRVRRMRVIVAVPLAQIVARSVTMRVWMKMRVAVNVVMPRDANDIPGVSVSVIRERQLQRHQQGLPEQAQADEHPEESSSEGTLHRVVP